MISPSISSAMIRHQGKCPESKHACTKKLEYDSWERKRKCPRSFAMISVPPFWWGVPHESFKNIATVKKNQKRHQNESRFNSKSRLNANWREKLTLSSTVIIFSWTFKEECFYKRSKSKTSKLLNIQQKERIWMHIVEV